MELYTLGASAFAAGCISYTIDALKRPRRPFYIVGCFLFDIGSILFISDSIKRNQNKSK